MLWQAHCSLVICSKIAVPTSAVGTRLTGYDQQLGAMSLYPTAELLATEHLRVRRGGARGRDIALHGMCSVFVKVLCNPSDSAYFSTPADRSAVTCLAALVGFPLSRVFVT